jgi:hypothetical protein
MSLELNLYIYNILICSCIIIVAISDINAAPIPTMGISITFLMKIMVIIEPIKQIALIFTQCFPT